jgi:coenzyme F420-0:L-glutamate ligase / coenzyme F420-1:gamma-L-glutamate ligase
MIADARAATFEHLVQQRRSIRQFRSESVPRTVIANVLRTAMWAPSPHNVQPWRFTVLADDADKSRLADAMAARLENDLRRDKLPEALIARQTARSRWRLTTAPTVVVCCLVRDGLVDYADERRSRFEWEMAVQSMGAVLQTLFLAAAAHEVGTCWMAAPMYCPEDVRSAVALPDDYMPQALVLMGYPAAPGKVRARRPFEEVVDFR